MKSFKASRIDCQLVCQTGEMTEALPYIRDEQGDRSIVCISPIHGRSFVLKHENDGRWIVGKGNGLGYTTHPFIITTHLDADTWGGLSLENALRDFKIGNEVRELHVKTNLMHGVMALEHNILQNGVEKQAALLQYSVECPYRISDIGFMPKEVLKENVQKWPGASTRKHLYAAEVLVSNLRILHDHHVMHNAMHPHNYTWALELVDFEASRSDILPYDNSDYESFVPKLIEIEIIQTYDIVNYIAWCLDEIPDYLAIESIIKNYGFELRSLNYFV